MAKIEALIDQKRSVTERLLKIYPNLENILNHLGQHAPDDLYMLLDESDGAAKLASELPNRFTPADVAVKYTGRQRLWELFGLFYLNSMRYYEASTLFFLLYEQLLSHQKIENVQVHKGVPLFWFARCHSALGNKVIAKRYFMLTLCEDAIKDKGTINLQDSGSYYTLVWHVGLPDPQLRNYVKAVWELHQTHEMESRFPDWSLQQLDQEWIVEVPNASEAGMYRVSRPYVRWLLDHTEDKNGKNLEHLAQYLIAAMPGCRALRRPKSVKKVRGILRSSA